MADIDAMQPHFESGKKLVIVGGGYIGLGSGSGCRQYGHAACMCWKPHRACWRALPSRKFQPFYTRLHEDHGVTLVTESQMTGFAGDGAVSGVEMADGSIVEADIVITGIGILPNVELAEAAGLEVDDGIVVNQLGQTNDPAYFRRR